MDNSKPVDRRRNVLDIVADLGFLDRRQPGVPAEAPPPPPGGPALTLVPSVKETVDSGPAPQAAASEPDPVAPVARGPHLEVERALTEAQRRAAEQRASAERFLQEALALEKRLEEEASQVRAANEYAVVQQLAAALENAVELERNAADHVDACAKKLERIAVQKSQAEALRVDDQTARETAAQEVVAIEVQLAEVRRKLEIATAACTESNQRSMDIGTVEEAARFEQGRAQQLADERRIAREKIETELHAMEGRVTPFTGTVPSLAAVEQLRALEARSIAQPPPAVPLTPVTSDDAAARLAERRAADAARRIEERRAADVDRNAAS